MSKTVFYIVRHGESIGNRQGRLLGHTDLDLTYKGYAQAQRTAEALSEVHFDTIYSSDLMRAYNTALPHARLRRMEVIKDKQLREAFVGEWENKLKQEVGEEYHTGFIDNFGSFRFPGGESIEELACRIYKEIESIAEKEQGRVILIGTHAAAIRAFVGKVLNLSALKLSTDLPFPSNASYTVIEYEDGTFILKKYSVDEHLSDIFTTWVR